MRELHSWKYPYLMWTVLRAQCRGSSQQPTQADPLAYIVSLRESESLCIFTESAAHLPVLFAKSCVGDGVSNWPGMWISSLSHSGAGPSEDVLVDNMSGDVYHCLKAASHIYQ